MITHEFSLPELRRIMQREPTTNERESIREPAAASWDENLGYEGARKACWQGVRRKRLTKLATKLREHMKMREVSGNTQRLTQRRGILDKGRYAQGHHKCLWREQPDRTRLRMLKIGVEMTASWMVNAQVWEQRGAAVLALLRAAQEKGTPVALDMVLSIQDAFVGKMDGLRITLHLARPGERVSQGLFNFFTAHAGAFRRCGFRLMEEVAAIEGTDVRPYYGAPAHWKAPEYDLWVDQWTSLKSPEDLMDTAISWTKHIEEEL